MKLTEENQRLRAALQMPEAERLAEIARLKQSLEYNRKHKDELIAENKRLREGRGLLPPTAANAPVIVTVHPSLVPPRRPAPPPPAPAPAPVASPAPARQKRARQPVYSGEKPLRTQWPLEGA